MRSNLRVLLFLILPAVLPAQEADTTVSGDLQSAVIVDGDTLFVLRAPLGPFSAAERAQRAMDNLVSASAAPGFSADSLTVAEQAAATTILFGDKALFAVSDDDAALERSDRGALTVYRLGRVRAHYSRSEGSVWDIELLISVGIALTTLLGLIGLFWAFRTVFPRLYAAMEASEGKLIRGIRIRSYELVSTASVGDLFQILARGLRLFLSLVAVYVALTVSLHQFSMTRDIGLEPYLFGFLTSILVTAAAYGIIRGILKFHTWSARLIHGWKGTLIRPVRIKSVEVLSEERIAELLVLTTKFGRFIIVGFMLYFYISIILGLFPLTSTWSEILFGYILTPFMNAITAFINYIPNLFSIIVIIALTHYLLRFMRFISMEIGRGTLTLPGFFPDWALPTFKIARFLVIVFAAVVIFPYLPGSNSPFFQGISIFVGVLFSLGSSSAVANIVSGVVLTYMRPFQIGDRVKIADTMGDIVEKTLLVTRVRTIKNVDITIPNAMVLGAHIVNYSSSSENRGLILHTSVTIGYDVPWRKVHELLLEAAHRSQDILDEPKPFVYQTALNDFSVAYELNAYTDEPAAQARIYSQIHEHIQDVFNDAGVEILSPVYSALRDGNESTIPADKRPPGMTSGSFRFRHEE